METDVKAAVAMMYAAGLGVLSGPCCIFYLQARV